MYCKPWHKCDTPFDNVADVRLLCVNSVNIWWQNWNWKRTGKKAYQKYGLNSRIGIEWMAIGRWGHVFFTDILLQISHFLFCFSPPWTTRMCVFMMLRVGNNFLHTSHSNVFCKWDLRWFRNTLFSINRLLHLSHLKYDCIILVFFYSKLEMGCTEDVIIALAHHVLAYLNTSGSKWYWMCSKISYKSTRFWQHLTMMPRLLCSLR